MGGFTPAEADKIRRAFNFDPPAMKSPLARTNPVQNRDVLKTSHAAFYDTPLGKVLRFVGKGEEFGSELILGNVLKHTDPLKYNQLKARGGPIYASDWMRGLMPDANPLLRGPVGLTAAIALDPITYATFGLGNLTKLGKLSKALQFGVKDVRLGQHTGAVKQLGKQTGKAIPPAGDKKAIEKFITDNMKALDELSLEERVRSGLTSAVQLHAPRLGTLDVSRHIGEGLREGLERIGVAPRMAAAVGLEVQGVRVAKVLDGTRAALRHNATAQAMNRWFGFRFMYDPQAVGIYRKLIDLLHGDLGKLNREVGTKIERRLQDLAADLHKLAPDMNPADVRGRLNSLITDLTEHQHVIPGKSFRKTARRPVAKDYAEFQKRVDEHLGVEMSSPFLGGPAHPADPKLMRQIRELVRHSNEYNKRVLDLEADAGLPIHELLGDINYTVHSMSDDARDVWRAARSALPANTRKSLQDLITKDMSLIRRQMGNLNEEGVLGLLNNSEALKWASKSKANRTKFNRLVHGVVIRDEADFRRIVSRVSVLLRDGKVSPDEANNLLSAIRTGRKKGFDRGKARSEAMDTARKLYDEGAIDREGAYGLIHPWSIREANEYIATHGLQHMGIKPGQIRQFFTENPTVMIRLRGERAMRAVTEKQYMQALSQEFGVPLAQAGEGWVKGSDLTGLKGVIPNIDDLYFDPSVAGIVQQYEKFYRDPDTILGQFLGLNDKLLRWWKSWTLAIFPSYHSRNHVGNMWNNFLAGMTTADQARYGFQANELMSAMSQYQVKIEANDLMGARKSLVGKNIVVDGRKVNILKLWEEGANRNLWDTGMATGDIEQTIVRAVAKEARRKKSVGAGKYVGLRPTIKTEDIRHLGGSDSVILDLGFRIAGRIENNAKLSHFMWRIAKGDSYDAAALSVKKHLFDYTDLTTKEREVMKRLFPFYTWTRKNVPLQLEMLMTKPEKFARVPKVIRGVQDAAGVEPGVDETEMVDWMKESFPVRIKKNAKGQHEYFLLESWLPAMDLNRVTDLWHMTKSMANPVPKFFVEQMFNQDLRSGRKIDALEAGLLDAVNPFSSKAEQDRVLGQYLNRRYAYTAKGYFRAIRDMDKLFANPDDMSIVARLMNFGVGRVYANDPARARLEMIKQVSAIDEATRFAARSLISKFPDSEGTDRAVANYGRSAAERKKKVVNRKGR